MKNKPYTKQSINWIATFLLVAFAIMQQTSAIAQCNNDPVFTQTPACGSTISATVGTALTIFIGTSDADGNIHMTLSSGTLPSGAVMSPPLPEFDNPPSSNFQWTPGSGAVGNHTITFTVEDDCGVQTTCSFTINVTNPCSGSGSPVFVAPTPTCGSTMTATPGVPLTFSVSASDVGHPSNPITLTMSGNSAALSTAILSPTLPVTGNPVNASFSWTPTFADIGLQQAGFKIHDPCTNGNEFCFYDIDVVSPCVGQGSPVFVAPTPPCGSTISATAGIAMSFSLTASDINNPANPITLTSTGSGIPSGATMTPSLPQTANPVSSTFNWTPSSGDVGQHAAEFKIHDPCTNGNEYCFFTIDVLPASSFCDITNIVLQNISACNNNGTIDTTDDFVTADIVVDFVNPPTTANFQIDPISDVYGTYSIPVSSLVGNTHTFTGVHVKADGTTANLKIEFTANSNRCAQGLIGAVIPHCPSPCATAVIDDNNNCTIDACEPLTGIVTHTPVVIPDPVISGADAICINTQETYSVPYDDNATYLWTVPTGVNIVSGQGSALIVVQFTSVCQSGTICVMATTPCGNSNTVCKAIAVINKVPTLGAITFQTSAVCVGATLIYCVPAVAGVTNYVWTIPANTQFIAGQGTNCILIQIQTGFTTGVITVKAQNCKGFSGLKSLTIRKLPLIPGAISGPANNLCQKTGVVFSIANVTNAASYLWTVPTGGTIVNGQGTTSITVDFAANFTTGNVSVNGVNNCGNGPVRNLAVKAKPTTPSVISGATSVCAHATAVPYSVTSIAGINYAWTLPSGSSVASGQGTANITANWGTVSGNVKVIPSNACGNGPYRTKAVTVNGCPRLWNENDSTDETVLSVYPNPVNSMLTVEFKNELEEECLITITDMIGKNIYNATANTIEGTNKNLIDVSRYNKGLYLLSIKGKNINQSVMIAIQ